MGGMEIAEGMRDLMYARIFRLLRGWKLFWDVGVFFSPPSPFLIRYRRIKKSSYSPKTIDMNL